MPESVKCQVSIANDFREAKKVEDGIVAAAQGYAYPDEDLFALRLSLEEALTNAIRHGNGCDPGKHVHVRYAVTPHQVDIYVADEGRGFDPSEIPDPTTAENIELPSGRGIMLMRAYMNRVEYNPQGNEVHLVKRREAS